MSSTYFAVCSQCNKLIWSFRVTVGASVVNRELADFWLEHRNCDGLQFDANEDSEAVERAEAAAE